MTDNAVTDLYDSKVVYPPLPSEEEIEALRGTRALRTPPRADVNLDVPYIHQLWDTPEDFNGKWACGPTSAAMVLAYYELLESRPIECPDPDPHTNDYGWYVSGVFTHNGQTFDATAPTKDGQGAGIYGTVVDRIGDGWGAHWRSPQDRGIRPLMDAFLPDVGNNVKFMGPPKHQNTIFMQREPAERAMKGCLDAGHPLIVSGRFTFRGERYDHLIVVRGYYRDSETNALQWIVNDPYGFETTGRGFDGDNVVYEFTEIKPKWMCIFSGSHVPKQRNSNYIPIRLFDKDSNEQVGEGTLIRGTDKVYIKRLEP